MCSLLSVLYELHTICIALGLVTNVLVLTQRRSSIMRGGSMWVNRVEDETVVVKLNGEADRRVHMKIEFTNKT